MFRTFLSSLLFLSLFCQSTAQDIEFYKNLAKTEQDTTLKMAALDSVIYMSFRKDNELFVSKSLEYIVLAKEQNDLKSAAKKAINLQSVLTYAMNDSRKAITVIDGVLSHKYKIDDSFLIGTLYFRRGRANYPIDLDAAIKNYSQSILNYSKTDYNYKGNSHIYRGHAYSDQGKFILASEDYQMAYTLFEKLKDYELMLYAQQGNITMYSIHGFFDKAKVERDRYLKKAQELDLDYNYSLTYYNQAIDYEKQGRYDDEFDYLLKAEAELDKNNSKQVFVGVHSKLAEYFSREGNFDEAENHLKMVEDDLNVLLNKNPTNQLIYEGAKATYFHKLEQDNSALKHATTRYNIAKNSGHQEDKRDSYLQLAEIHESLGNYKNAMTFQKAYVRSKDSIFNQSNAFTLAYYQTLYETEKKEKALVERNNDVLLLENENSSFKRKMIFIALFTIGLFVVILLFRNQKYLRNNKTLQERFSQELIVSQENERMRISNDLHDGIGQQLLLIKNKLVRSNDNNVKLMVENAIDEIRTISRDLHPFQLQELGITKAIEYALVNIDENTNLFISSEIDNIDNIFSPEHEVNIYRIVQESLTNVIKHAEAEAIKVSIMKLNKLIIITIKDNGIGFDFQEKFKNLKSLGLKTLLERTKFLDGQMKVQSSINHSTLLEYQFPIK
jgi:signal transduction histidine kinase